MKNVSFFNLFCKIHVESHKTMENEINQSAFKLNFCAASLSAAVCCHARGMSKPKLLVEFISNFNFELIFKIIQVI